MRWRLPFEYGVAPNLSIGDTMLHFETKPDPKQEVEGDEMLVISGIRNDVTVPFAAITARGIELLTLTTEQRLALGLNKSSSPHVTLLSAVGSPYIAVKDESPDRRALIASQMKEIALC